MNERTNERTNQRTNERTNERNGAGRGRRTGLVTHFLVRHDSPPPPPPPATVIPFRSINDRPNYSRGNGGAPVGSLIARAARTRLIDARLPQPAGAQIELHGGRRSRGKSRLAAHSRRANLLRERNKNASSFNVFILLSLSLSLSLRFPPPSAPPGRETPSHLLPLQSTPCGN